MNLYLIKYCIIYNNRNSIKREVLIHGERENWEGIYPQNL